MATPIDKWQAQQAFWSSFGFKAYNELTVPEDAQLPYITYQLVDGSLDGNLTASGSLYMRGTTWTKICQTVSDMEKVVDRQIPIVGGVMKVRKPIANFAQPLNDPSDTMIRRMVLMVEIEFLTE